MIVNQLELKMAKQSARGKGKHARQIHQSPSSSDSSNQEGQVSSKNVHEWRSLFYGFTLQRF